MKLISILLICLLPLASCRSYVIPEQEMADMPIDPGPQRKPEPVENREQRRSGLSDSQKHMIWVAAAIAAAAWAMSDSDRGNCNDCKGDGVVHKGDPHTYKIRVFKRAYRCPVCEGQGHL